jgi:heptaprenyl diphosphate synthase
MEEGVYTLPVLRTLATGRSSADELRALLGEPLDAVQRARALEIVRSEDGIEGAIVAAREFVGHAVNACDHLGDDESVEALRLAPAALLATVLSATSN